MKYVPHPYQIKGTAHILDDIVEDTMSRGCFFTVGTGKSVMSLTAIEELFANMIVNKPLIIGPSRVVSHTWPNEIKKWDHTKYLRISVIQHKTSYRSEQQRIKALNTPADIYAVSVDNICWLVHYCSKVFKKWPFDMIILDESSKFKNPSAARFKAVRRIVPYCRQVICLTATPASNSLLDLWSQVYLLDGGKRLGTTIGAYKDRYFIPGSRNGHVIFQYIPKKGAEEQIYAAIADICMSMKASDYLQLPERVDIFEEVELESQQRYLEFKKTEILKMADGHELTPVNAAVFYQILLQYCNGAIYRYRPDGTRYHEVIDNSKLNALIDEVEALQNDPVLIFVQFQSDFIRIKEAIPQAVKIETNGQIDLWNKGLIPVAMAHGLSLGHGLNLQDGGNHIIHFGLGWSLETYEQATGRLSRQGNKKGVINKHLICKGTVEELVLERLQNKAFTQESLFAALKRHLA